MEGIKVEVDKAATFDMLEMRLGRVLRVELADGTPKKTYLLEVDFGRFGKRTSVGRFTLHSPSDLLGKLVIGVLNFPNRQVGVHLSECLILGTQFPKGESGEATFLTPATESKVGGKVF